VTPQPEPISSIAGSVLPLQKAEELLSTLHEVVSARIVADSSGNVEAIHVLVTGDLTPKQMVRNIESALMAQLGMRVDHRKISIATTVKRPETPPVGHPVHLTQPFQAATSAQTAQTARPFQPAPAAQTAQAFQPAPSAQPAKSEPVQAALHPEHPQGLSEGALWTMPRGAANLEPRKPRELYFEDVEMRGSRAKGMVCKVTLRRGKHQIVGESEGTETDKSRVELSARATLAAVSLVDGNSRSMTLEGAKVVNAFDRELVLVGVTVRQGRGTTLLMGSCEIKDSAETASALAVLNATNRWVEGV
jgi:nucleoid-associated protein YgaU